MTEDDDGEQEVSLTHSTTLDGRLTPFPSFGYLNIDLYLKTLPPTAFAQNPARVPQRI